jgi:hypothetical protein
MLNKVDNTTIQSEAISTMFEGVITPLPSLTLTMGITGLGGISKLKKHAFYYVYVNRRQGEFKLIGVPKRYCEHCKEENGAYLGSLMGSIIGFFRTDGDGNIAAVSGGNSGNVGDTMVSTLSESEIQAEHGPGWILSDGRSVAGGYWAELNSTDNVPNVPANNGNFTYVNIA